jgi:hypothetical protein
MGYYFLSQVNFFLKLCIEKWKYNELHAITTPTTVKSHLIVLKSTLWVDLSIFRAGPGSGRVEKIYVISGRKNPAHDHPTGRVGPQFSGRARAGPELGWAARAFYSVKQLNTAFRVKLGRKKISRASRSLPTLVQ